MKSWVTKTAGWGAILIGFAGLALGMFEVDMAVMIITNGMGYVGIDRKFKRMAID
jgi:hypothetical protein